MGQSKVVSADAEETEEPTGTREKSGLRIPKKESEGLAISLDESYFPN